VLIRVRAMPLSYHKRGTRLSDCHTRGAGASRSPALVHLTRRRPRSTSAFRQWPLATHHIAEQPAETVVLEPFVGGRWYERSRDGNETPWGRVLAFEPPHRLLLGWQMSSDWVHEQDPARGSEIEVSFLAETRNRTRVVFEHRHLERYGEQAERMRAALERPKAAEAVLRAFANRVAAAKTARRRKAA
jgi:uncharacterized protein YndB with AHSA1/START domain